MAKLDKSVRISQKTQNRPPVSYGDSAWGDLLTSFKGCTISYDEIGNPENLYLRGRDYVMTWTAGRRLAAMTNSAGNEYYTFTYNDEGIRTSKTAYGTTHNYLLSGSQIIAEDLGNILLVYLYDENGSPMGMQYRTSSMAENTFYTFWFEKNLQGDIIAVYNESGTKLITYTYDAWGNVAEAILNHSGNNLYATYNPFRYRGYYYDTETQLYYLQSRYYSPEMGRFINADSTDYINADSSPLSCNLFAYCNNNPITRKDEEGCFWNLIAGAVIGATISIGVSYITAKLTGEEYTWKNALVDGVSGAITGLIASTGAGAIVQCLVGVAVGAASSMATDLLNGEEISFARAINAAALGGITGYLGGAGLRADSAVKSADKTCIKVLNKAVNGQYATVRGAKSAMTQAINRLHKALIPATIKTTLKYTASTFANNWGMYFYDSVQQYMGV